MEEGVQKQPYLEELDNEVNSSSDDPKITEGGEQKQFNPEEPVTKSRQGVMISSLKQLKRGKHTCLVMKTEHLRAPEIVL